MDWERYKNMDPHLLVGIVNTKIRNDYLDLDELCATHDLDKLELIQKLGDAGYDYVEAQRQFR